MSTPASFGTGLAATGAFVAGLVAVFIAERVLGAGSGRVALAALGVVVAVAATAWRVVRMLAAPVARRTLERWVLTLYGLGLLALALYFVKGDVGTALVGEPLSRSSPRLSGVLSVLFPALLLCALVPLAMVEAALVAMARAPVPETGRVRSALFSGLGVAFAVVFAFAATYVATEADASWDLSYFRTAKPGEATRKLVRGLNEPLQVTVFFPPPTRWARRCGSTSATWRRRVRGWGWRCWTRRWSPRVARRWGSATTARWCWRGATARRS